MSTPEVEAARAAVNAAYVYAAGLGVRWRGADVEPMPDRLRVPAKLFDEALDVYRDAVLRDARPDAP